MLSKPVVTKGEAAEFILSINEVLSLPTVSGDSYFSDVYNWKEVALHYASEDKSQKETVICNTETGAGIFEVSVHAKDNFQLQAIVIHDFDNGKHLVKRQDLAEELLEEFDIIFS